MRTSFVKSWSSQVEQLSFSTLGTLPPPFTDKFNAGSTLTKEFDWITENDI